MSLHTEIFEQPRRLAGLLDAQRGAKLSSTSTACR